MKRFPSLPRLAVFTAAAVLACAPSARAAVANTCVFLVSMTSGTDVNNLDFVVNYAGADGNVEGTENRPECARALPGQSFASFRDDDAASKLYGGIIRLAKFSAPVPLFGCRMFYDTVKPQPDDFILSVTNAGRDGEDNNVAPKPQLAVTSVECPGELPQPTTTIPDTTTTTLVVGEGCGVPVSGGPQPKTSDALYALKAAIGAVECDLCACDVNDSGSLTAGDALAILQAAVGGDVDLVCPAC